MLEPANSQAPSTMPDEHVSSLPYHEPNIVTILIFSSFILLLNSINSILNDAIYCGLLGQVLLGIAWGIPGASWLNVAAQEVIVQVGYLGLLLLVYEGGLATSIKSLRANLLLSLGVAITGISVPIGLSYGLMTLVGATPLQAFAAGAALCSTSLGTTFTVLSASKLTTTRMGVVLTSAAMMDDVVGLVMVQVISNLGSSSESFSATTVIRPVFVSLAFAVVVPLGACTVVKPVTVSLNTLRVKHRSARMEHILAQPKFVFVVHTLFLVAMVTGSSYAGTSNLFAAYLTGAAISWWDTEVPHVSSHHHDAIPRASNRNCASTSGEQQNSNFVKSEHNDFILPDTTGEAIFHTLYRVPLKRILSPFFFASIGFSIPITRLFSGSIVWKGVIYSVLMFFGKLLCGLWLVRLPSITTCFSSKQKAIAVTDERSTQREEQHDVPANEETSNAVASPSRGKTHAKIEAKGDENEIRPVAAHVHQDDKGQTTSQKDESSSNLDSYTQLSHPPRSNESRKLEPLSPDRQIIQAPSTRAQIHQTNQAEKGDQQLHSDQHPHRTPDAPKPISLYPAAILGTAMVARGEIGFLISSIAQSNGIFNPSSASSSSSSSARNAVGTHDEESPIFLVVTWAILLCTFLGPLCVGFLVKRVRKLESQGGNGDGKGTGRDVLGVWGVT